MIHKIRNWLYFFAAAWFTAVGWLIVTVTNNKIYLFSHLPIPAVSKFALPIITTSVFIIWGLIILIRMGNVAEAEERDDWDIAKQISTKIVLESPTVCVLFSLISIIILDGMQEYLISWETAKSIYGYMILCTTLIPCLVSFMEFVQGFRGFPELPDSENKYLKKSQTIDGTISSIVSLAAFALLIFIGDMSVCSYMYFAYIALLLYRIVRYYHITAYLWTEETARATNDVDKKEGIL